MCAFESMQAAHQHLKDAGYRSGITMEEEEEDDSNVVDEEVKLAPWRTTRNVLNACDGKGMVQMTGIGDPTGRGEGYNFMRVPLRASQQKFVSMDPSAQKQGGGLAGTDSDLRRMSIRNAKEMLKKMGMKEEEINDLSRWELIGKVRNLSSETSLAEQKFARQSRFSVCHTVEPSGMLTRR